MDDFYVYKSLFVSINCIYRHLVPVMGSFIELTMGLGRFMLDFPMIFFFQVNRTASGFNAILKMNPR